MNVSGIVRVIVRLGLRGRVAVAVTVLVLLVLQALY